MSRTRRRMPRRDRNRPTGLHAGRKGGATASKGPSSQCRRPDVNYDADIIHLGAELLQSAAHDMETSDFVRTPTIATGGKPNANQARWHAATNGDLPIPRWAI